jgi:single-stranded DNA-specific DHH superfamily exonuclease
MTLTTPQFSELVENYAEHIVDGLDNDSLAQLCFDLLCKEYETYTEKEIVREIRERYGDEITADLIQSTGADPDTIL